VITAVFEQVKTPDGVFTIIGNDMGRVLASGWTEQAEEALARIPRTLRPRAVQRGKTQAGQAVGAYYAGDLSAIDSIETQQPGTAFHLAGWAELRKIQAGTRLTYTDLAVHLGRASAVRAAASICAKNAAALFVPCHRVLRMDGSLGGFAWGLEVKQSLLKREAQVA
jgi:methylated-DNA-[protein]-cysteine S-methyltransferase